MQATDAGGVVSDRPGSDTGISTAPEMLMLQNNRGDLVLFCVYGAELVVAVPAKKKGLAEIVNNPKTIESITDRSRVKMSGANDIAHAFWKGKILTDSAIEMTVPIALGSVRLVYSLSGDTITAACTLRRPRGVNVTVTKKSSLLTDMTSTFNNELQTVYKDLFMLD